jgi:hypothetical protein
MCWGLAAAILQRVTLTQQQYVFWLLYSQRLGDASPYGLLKKRCNPPVSCCTGMLVIASGQCMLRCKQTGRAHDYKSLALLSLTSCCVCQRMAKHKATGSKIIAFDLWPCP